MTQKKLSDFAKVQFLNDKIDQNTNFAKCQMAIFCFTVNCSAIFVSPPLVSERKFEGTREKLKHKNGTYVSSRAEAMVWVPLICNTTTPRFACVINCHTVTEALSYIQVKVFLNRAPFESTKNGYLLKDFVLSKSVYT